MISLSLSLSLSLCLSLSFSPSYTQSLSPSRSITNQSCLLCLSPRSSFLLSLSLSLFLSLFLFTPLRFTSFLSFSLCSTPFMGIKEKISSVRSGRHSFRLNRVKFGSRFQEIFRFRLKKKKDTSSLFMSY